MTKPELRAELILASLVAHPGDELSYAIANTGAIELICGLAYLLERFDDQDWVAVNPGMAFELIGFGVEPGERKELTVRIPDDAALGRYRISTRVYGRFTPPAYKLTATFEVVSSR